MVRRVAMIICLAVALWMPSFVKAFGVSPATMDVSIRRGEAAEATVTIINNGTAEQTYYLGTMAFVPDATSGAPQFLSSGEDRSGLSGWISFPFSTVTVPAQTKVNAPFRVDVPPGAEFGTHYAAVTVSTAPSEVVAANGATIEAKTAMLLFLTVEGQSVEKFALLDFTSSEEGGIGSRMSVAYAFRIQNQGNVAIVPDAIVTITDVFGRRVAQTDANIELSRVLPETTRTFEGKVMEETVGFWATVRQQASFFAVGPLTVTLSLSYGETAETESFSLWYVPWQLMVTIVGAAALAWLLWRGITAGRNRLGSMSTGS